MSIIPKTLIVGVQEKRSDTLSGELSFVTYKTEKNTIHNESAFKHWAKCIRNEYDNLPQDGYIILGMIACDSGTIRKPKCRIRDPRGFEFEISMYNLKSLIDNGIAKGGIAEGTYILGFDNGATELILVDSEKYNQSKNASDELYAKAEKNNKKENCLYETKYGKYVFIKRTRYRILNACYNTVKMSSYYNLCFDINKSRAAMLTDREMGNLIEENYFSDEELKYCTDTWNHLIISEEFEDIPKAGHFEFVEDDNWLVSDYQIGFYAKHKSNERYSYHISVYYNSHFSCYKYDYNYNNIEFKDGTYDFVFDDGYVIRNPIEYFRNSVNRTNIAIPTKR